MTHYTQSNHAANSSVCVCVCLCSGSTAQGVEQDDWRHLVVTLRYSASLHPAAQRPPVTRRLGAREVQRLGLLRITCSLIDILYQVAFSVPSPCSRWGFAPNLIFKNVPVKFCLVRWWAYPRSLTHELHYIFTCSVSPASIRECWMSWMNMYGR